MGNWDNKWKSRSFLADGQTPGFGKPRDENDPILWRPWSKDERWAVAAAYQQHRLAMELNRVLNGTAKAADGFVPPPDASKVERRAALAEHLGVPNRTLESRMAGQSVCTARELLGMVSVAGIGTLPIVVAELLPKDEEVEGGL